MSKIENDKYYTSKELAKYCVEKTKEVIGITNITEYIEPSAGSGVFLDYLNKPHKGYDIEPEDTRIMKQEYLALDIPYLKGRCIIGNPPYGRVNNLATQFYKKSVLLGDYISFILPISQFNNNIKMYEFDLIYSEDLGVKKYSDIDVHCCLNIYRRPYNGTLNKKPNYKLKDVKIYEHHNIRNYIAKTDIDYDIRICSWGNAIGKEVLTENEYFNEMCIVITNNTYRKEIIDIIKQAKWKDIYPMTATPRLKYWQVYKYIKEQIPEIA